jgi:transglutaminase-like putative cysteine protease
MASYARNVARRLRPRIGWDTAVLAFVAACAPAIAASGARLRLPAGSFFWSGVLGLALGLAAARALGAPRPDLRGSAGGRLARLRVLAPTLLWLTGVALLGALFILGAGVTMPPLGLITQDAGELIGWAAAILRREAPLSPPPSAESLAFLGLSLARFRDQLIAAPNAGDAGARLLVTVTGVALTWVGAWVFGRALPNGRQVIGWSLPLLAALTVTSVLGNAGGAGLAIGIIALLLAAIATHQRSQRARWERSGTDYSEELSRDVLSWGLGLIIVTLTAAWIVPLWPGNPIAQLFQRNDLPSGITALQRGLGSPRSRPETRVGVSSLPAVLLGETLEQGPPEEVALRVRVGGPLPEGPNPRYWRVRLLNIYTGSGWSSDALVGAQEATQIGGELPDGLVLQEVEDLRRNPALLTGMADVVAVSVPARSERLYDGALAALVADEPGARYRVLSRPMELAPPPPVDREPPDMSGYLSLPISVTPRVRDLASIVSDSGSRRPALERAAAIEQYLRSLPYAYEVEPVPRGGDAVDQFLFEMRQGYCTYYASAMAVMARSIGIPARVAVGYATGEYDPATGAYTVREAEAHAWPELYIDNRWVIFEPTPVRPLPARTDAPPEEQAAESQARAEERQPDRTTGPLIWAGVLALVALLTAASLLAGRSRPPRSAVALAQRALERFGVSAGVAWPAGATLHEYGDMLAPHANGQAAALRDVVELVGLARYGGRPLAPEEERRLTVACERLEARH